ncbi:uncharacterized protein EI90DRAFT_2457020 [Cantharellus anzutake]|uniref:uncharacterized protein n=1 Tax=Cantharellus anzutake TaxID=1750568 RepID=UPI0019041F22|nr:uncharacterized protein EI90DRAFT_2457020 [Cantharellus anzutake]KAF8339088.1 hypothetical protein EI90DRAFT_2457020 [Cantharellus anzutake]
MLDIDRARELACPVMTSWIRQQRRHQPTAPLDVEQILREHGGAEELRGMSSTTSPFFPRLYPTPSVTTPSGGGSTSHHGKHPIDTWSGDFSSLDDESACVVRPLEFEITQDVYHNWIPSAETQELLNSPTELPQDGSQIYDYLTPEGSFSASDVQQSYANAGNAAWYQPGPSFNEEITDMICSPEFDALLDSGFILTHRQAQTLISDTVSLAAPSTGNVLHEFSTNSCPFNVL